MTTKHVWFHDWDGAEGRVTVEAFLAAFKELDLPTRLDAVSDVLIEANKIRRPNDKSPIDGVWSAGTAKHFSRSWKQAEAEQERFEERVKDLAVSILKASSPLASWDYLFEATRAERLDVARKLLAKYDITPKAAE